MKDSLTLSRSQKVLLLILFLVIVILYSWQAYENYQAVKNEVGTDASSVFATTNKSAFVLLDETDFDFAALRGQPRVVTLWASWSPFSKQDIPLVSKLSESYQPSDVAFILLNRSEPTVRAESYLTQFSIPDNVEVVVDVNDNVYAQSDGYAMPETIIYDANGNIHAHIRGPLEEAKLRSILDSLLEG